MRVRFIAPITPSMCNTDLDVIGITNYANTYVDAAAARFLLLEDGMEVTPLKKETLTEQVMAQIAEKVTSGEIAPGERLPDERSLAEMFGVTRARVREALRALSLIGLLTIKPGGGTYVTEDDALIPRESIEWTYHREAHNFSDVYTARKLIETAVYLACFDCKTDEVVARLGNYSERLLTMDIDNITGDEFMDELDKTDLYVGHHCGNAIFDKLMQTDVILRRDSAIRISSVPTSRASAVLMRMKVLSSFGQNNRSVTEHAIDNFFESSIKSVTEINESDDPE